MDNFVFRDCVLSKFKFLTSLYGFRCMRAESTYLRFESETVFVELQYDGQGSFEIDLSIGLLDELYDGKERPFYFKELIRFAAPDSKKNYQLIQASSSENVIHSVSEMAELIQKYAKELLSGNKSSFKALSDYREKECNKYALEIELRNIRSAVKKAWEQKDYASVVKLFDPIKNQITPSEFKKLEYSRKHK